MACIQECQTFVWGGAGTPTTDDAGRCSCTCEGEGWSEYNILGEASCVPIQAHVIFGAVGLAYGIVSMCHATYELRRQVKFHAHQISASTSPIEQCRRLLHMVVIAHACLVLGYFFVVLVLESDQLWRSTIFFAGLTQFTVGIGGILTVRMWIYTNDPRLMRETPEILAISSMLQHPVGRYISYGLFSVGPAVATILTSAKRSYAAVVVATGSFIFLCVACNLIILKCGTSLIRTINGSLRNSAGNTQTVASITSNPSMTRADKDGNNGTTAARKEQKANNLLAARKKVAIAMSACVASGAIGIPLLMFAIFSGYGRAAPLLFFGLPMGLGPCGWFVMNVQLHAGRSKPRTQLVKVKARTGPRICPDDEAVQPDA